MGLSPDEIGSTDADFHGHFDRIADLLMNSVAMVVNNQHRYRLVEIEFYLNGGKHPDVFTHSCKDQQTCGEWYFHKMNGTYKGGSYKGLDITFGKAGVSSRTPFSMHSKKREISRTPLSSFFFFFLNAVLLWGHPDPRDPGQQ